MAEKTQTDNEALLKSDAKVPATPAPAPVTVDDKAPAAIAQGFAGAVSVAKTTMPISAVAVLGIMAGAYIGFGGLLSTTVSFDAAAKIGTGLASLVKGAVFSVGLMLVVIAGAELFTGNNLMVTGVLTKKISVGSMLHRWIVVFVANFAGSLLLAALLYYSGLWKTGDNGLGVAAIKVAAAKVALPFGEALWRAIGCNWLVCLAVWMAASARQNVGKIFAIFFPIMAFVTMGFEHCVANMYFIPAGIFLSGVPALAEAAGVAPGAITWGGFLANNLLPVTIGNIIGGMVFVGMGYWFAYLRPAK
ncbi:MAG: formate/nitrite transporter family protein [Acidobacteriota bacterium]|nr:formate/nitrite transporter family protein [Acidobacteriota bacterium]